MNEAYVNKAIKTKKHRGLKNFGWVMLGVLCGILVLIVPIALVLKFMPIKDATDMAGVKDTDKYISENISNKSVIDNILALDTLLFADIPYVETVVKELTEETLTIDWDKFNAHRIFDIGPAIEEVINNINVNEVVNNTLPDDADMLIAIIRDLTGISSGNILLGDIDLDVVDMDNIKLNSVMPKSSKNTKLYDVLEDMTGKGYQEVTIGDLEDGTDIDDIHLTTVLEDTAENKELLDVLKDMIDVKRNENLSSGQAPSDIAISEITLGDLKGLELGKVKLATVIEVEEDGNTESLFNVIVNAINNNAGYTGEKLTNDTVTIDDLQFFKTGGINMTQVLSYAGNEEMYDILLDATGVSDVEDLKIDSLSNFYLNRVHLKTVLPITAQTQNLYDILSDATGTAIDDITIASVKNFDIDNVHLTTVIPYEEVDPSDSADEKEKKEKIINLYHVLQDAIGEDKDDITLSSLDSFNMNDVKLSTVLRNPDGTDVSVAIKGNKLLEALANDPDATLGTIGATVNALHIQDIWTQECFTKNKEDSKSFAKYRLDESTGTYYLDSTVADADAYYIATYAAKFWMFLFYDYKHGATVNPAIDFDGNGNALQYKQTNWTYGEMNDAMLQASLEIEGATIKQLIDCGVLLGDYPTAIWPMQLNQALSPTP